MAEIDSEPNRRGRGGEGERACLMSMTGMMEAEKNCIGAISHRKVSALICGERGREGGREGGF